MNLSCRRFLALNCVLHGHALTDAFDGDISLCAKAFDRSVSDMQDLQKALIELEQKPSLLKDESPSVLSILNFFRCNEYAFLYIPGAGRMILQYIKDSDISGELSDDVRRGVLRMILNDVTFVESTKEINVTDGVVSYVAGTSATLGEDVEAAYRLYRDGPVLRGGKRLEIVANGAYLQLATYKSLTARTHVSMLKELVSAGIRPTDLSKTALVLPDLFTVYKSTSTIMCRDDVDSEYVYWMLDQKGKQTAKVVHLAVQAIKPLLISSLNDLSNIEYQVGAPRNGLVVKE